MFQKWIDWFPWGLEVYFCGFKFLIFQNSKNPLTFWTAVFAFVVCSCICRKTIKYSCQMQSERKCVSIGIQVCQTWLKDTILDIGCFLVFICSQLLVQILFAKHIWEDFGSLEVNSPYGKQKMEVICQNASYTHQLLCSPVKN